MLTRKQLAKELKVSIATVDRWRQAQIIPAVKQVNRRVLFDRREVTKALRNRPCPMCGRKGK